MPSTTSRLSVVALGTLAALVAQELARTASVAPGTMTATPKPGSRDRLQPVSAPTPELTTPIAQPETISPQKVAGTAPAHPTPPSQSQPNQDSSGTGEKPTTPPAAITQRVQVRAVSVDRLPIDALVAASLQQGDRSISKLAAPKPPQSSRPEGNPTAVNQARVPLKAKSTPFADVQQHPSRTAIMALVQRQVVQGFPDGTFRPDAPVTDAEFDLLLRQAFQRNSDLVVGMKRPNDVVTRAQAAEFVYRQLLRAAAIAREATPTLVASRTPTGAMVAAPEMVAMQTAGVKAAIDGTASQLPKALPGKATFKQPPLPPLSPEEESYTLGPGDRIKIEVFGVPEYSRDYQVLVNGTLNLYLVGNLRVQGMTLDQLEKAVASRYSRLVRDPIVDVSLVAPRPLSVAIAGEISRPGSYNVDSGGGTKFPTVTRLIQQAGGMTQAANPSIVQIRRPQRSGPDMVITVNLWELFKTGDIRQDLGLRDGDMVFVPAAEKIIPAESAQLAAANFAADANQPLNVAIVGEVARPGPYVISRGSGGTSGGTSGGGSGSGGAGALTVTQAIQQAGGITFQADIRNVQVKRTTRSGPPQVINLDLWKLLDAGDLSQDLVLQQGDTITIPTATALTAAESIQQGVSTLSPSTIRINVVGEVQSPGTQQLPPNTTVNQALLAAGGFNKRARKRTVELIRLNPNGSVTRQEVAIDLDRGVDVKNNPLLRNNDIIVVKPTGIVKFNDTIETIIAPVNRLLPFFFLF